MKEDTPTPKKEAKPKAEPKQETEEANIIVNVIVAGTKIGTAICGLGRLPFPLKASDAKALEALGKVKIIGLK